MLIKSLQIHSVGPEQGGYYIVPLHHYGTWYTNRGIYILAIDNNGITPRHISNLLPVDSS